MTKEKKSIGNKWNKFLKVFGTTCLAIVLSISLTGCGKTVAPTPKSLVIWGFVDEDVFKPIIKDFNSKNKGITVKYYKKTLNSSYESDSLNSILSGQGPDVWAMPNDWVYRHKDKLTAASPATLTASKIDPAKYFNPNIVSDTIFDKQVYAMAPSTDVLQIYYNEKLFSESQDRAKKANKGNTAELAKISKTFSKLPVTWEDFDALIPYLTVKSGSNIQIAGAAIGTSNNVSYSADILSLLMEQNQTRMISDDLTQSTFNLPVKNSAGSDAYTGKDSLDFYSKYADPNSPTYTWNSNMPNDVEAFANEKVAMIFSYANLSNYFAQIYPKFTYKRMLMPQIGNLSPIVDYGRYTTYGVPENSVAKDLAWSFVAQLSTTSASTYKSATKEITAKKPATSTDPVLKNRQSSQSPTESILGSIVTWNKGRYPVELDNQFKDAITRVNNKAQGSQASLDTAAANITELLRKTTW